MHDTIEINNLTVNAIVGIYPQERITPQPLVFNLTIETDLRQVALRRSLENGLDYAAIAQDITDFTLATEPELLEPFAEEVANRILAHPAATGVTVHLTKPKAVENAGSVGIRIYRSG